MCVWCVVCVCVCVQHLFHNILGSAGKSVDPDMISLHLDLHCLHMLFCQKAGVHIFWTITIYMSKNMRKECLSHRHLAMTQTSLHIGSVSSELLLFADM